MSVIKRETLTAAALGAGRRRRACLIRQQLRRWCVTDFRESEKKIEEEEEEDEEDEEESDAGEVGLLRTGGMREEREEEVGRG